MNDERLLTQIRRRLPASALLAVLLAAPLGAGESNYLDDQQNERTEAEFGWDDDWNDDQDENAWGDDDWGDWNDTGDGGEISGYFESTGLTLLPRGFDGEPHFGLQSILRLRGQFYPANALTITVEAEYRDRRGAANSLTRQSLIGAPALVEQDQASFPGTDFNRELVVDYAYASARLGPLDLRAGRQPIAWGTAYAFNPTELMNPASLAELTGVEPPGLTAIAPGISIGTGFGLEGYVAFEDRSRRATALSGLAEARNLPFGVRVRAFAGMWDLAAGFIRALDAGPGADAGDFTPAARDYAVGEVAGPLGPVTAYAEAAVEITPEEEWKLERSIDGAIGFHYEMPFGLGLQVEYHRGGRGASDPADYDPQARIAGRLAARDYLVGIADYYLLDDTVHTVLASLVNLNDGSVTLIPEVQYAALPDLELGFGASLLLGPDGSEFDGRFDLPLDPNSAKSAQIDIGRSQLFLSAKWHF